MDEKEGFWGSEEFEDLVSEGLIALYDEKHSTWKKINKHVRISEQELAMLRNWGLYFTPSDRLVLSEIDVKNDGLADLGIIAMQGNQKDEEEEGNVGGYLRCYWTARFHKPIPKVWKKTHGGPAYIIYALIAREEGGVICAKKFVTISPKTGEIFPCYREHQTYDWGYWKHIKTLIDTPKDCEMTSIAVASCLGFYSDRKYLWNVAATEDGERKATFGVYEAQIKSLFYSRSAPNTSIGRKRPILHWVRSHTRRMKSGIDVDIEKHLRGVDRFEMGNTVFHITRPTKVHQNVGK